MGMGRNSWKAQCRHAPLCAARPLPVELRSEFLEAVAAALAGREVGPGLVHRMAHQMQRSYFSPERGAVCGSQATIPDALRGTWREGLPLTTGPRGDACP
jgi:hypothetical protein